LGRICNIFNEFKLISIFELARLLNLDLIIRDEINPKVSKIIDELELIGIEQKDRYLLDSSVKEKAQVMIEISEKKFEEEAHQLYVIIDYFYQNGLAENISSYRLPFALSLVNKFDAIGHGGRRKKATIIIECTSRRKVVLGDVYGYYSRVCSTISKGTFTKPVFSYLFSKRFSKDAIQFALSHGIRLVRIHKRGFYQITSPSQLYKKGKRLSGRLRDAQGMAFEIAVERAFRRMNYQTELRKEFFLKDNELTEEKTKTQFTDVDVIAQNDYQIIFIECKSARKQLERSKLFQIVQNFSRIADYYHNTQNESRKIVAIIIGNHNKLDAKDAKQRSAIPLEIDTPPLFYQRNRSYLKGEPRWLFQSEKQTPSEIIDILERDM
jgi:hypothetical protein